MMLCIYSVLDRQIQTTGRTQMGEFSLNESDNVYFVEVMSVRHRH